MSEEKKCPKCSGTGTGTGTGTITTTVYNETPPSYNYGNGDGCDYTDPSTGYPMGYEPSYESEETCPKCDGKGSIG